MSQKLVLILLFTLSVFSCALGQLKWTNVDSQFQPLPFSMHIFFTDDSLDGKPNRAFYAISSLKDPNLDFTVDTGNYRGFTPLRYFKKNGNPLLVVNCTFFSPVRKNLNVVVKEGKLLALNVPSVFDQTSKSYHYLTRSAIGIGRHRTPDVAWVFTDSLRNRSWQLPSGPLVRKGNSAFISFNQLKSGLPVENAPKRWKMKTAVGGGPTLISNGKITITNNEERMFAGERINEKHPRTAMGYTRDGYLVILVIEGRLPGKAEGATLGQEAQLLFDLGCYEALNLDGGGSSCMLVNGKETITPSDKTGQRPVPAVFLIQKKSK